MFGFHHFSSSEHAGHRFGFQGQEKDDEVKGNGNSINFKYRMHDPRIGRFFAIDPIDHEFAYNSPYAFSENRVIDGLEWEGLEVVLIGTQFGAGIGASGNIEGGIGVGPEGVFSYGSVAIGGETNVSISGQLSVTWFPNMPSSEYAKGVGFEGGIAVGEGIVGSVNAAYSGGYWGINITGGFGAGALPADASGYATFTHLETLTERYSKNEALALLYQSKNVISDRVNGLNQQRNDLLNVEDYDQKEVDNLTKQISELNMVIGQIDTGIDQVKSMDDDDQVK